MDMPRHKGEDGGFEIAPAGAFAARCFRVVDLGTQDFVVSGEQKSAHQIAMTWELGKLMANGLPYTITEKYTASLNKEAKLCAILESWRGRPFTEAEKNGFDAKKMVGLACFVNVVHVHKGDKTYANAATVMPMPDGMTHPTAVNELLYFTMDGGMVDEGILGKISEYYQNIIKRSPEYQKIMGTSSPAQPNPRYQQSLVLKTITFNFEVT